MQLATAALVLSGARVTAEPDVVISNRTFGAGENKAYWGAYTLQTMDTVVVQAGANVSFASGGIIRLAPGFRVDAGGQFRAVVQANAAFDPGNYYGGTSPTVAPLSPYIVYGAAGAFNAQMLDVAVWNTAGTAPLAGAPVLITIEEGEGWLSVGNGAGAVLTRTLELTTDGLGTVQVYFKQPTAIGAQSVVRVIAGNSSQLLRTQSYDGAAGTGGADTDGDGLTNQTEQSTLGTNPAVAAAPSTLPGLVVF